MEKCGSQLQWNPEIPSHPCFETCLLLDLNFSWTAAPNLKKVVEASSLTVTGTLTVTGCRHIVEPCAEGLLDLLPRRTNIYQLESRMEKIHFALCNSAQENVFTIGNKMKNLRNLLLHSNPMVNCEKAPSFNDMQFELLSLKSLEIYGETVLPEPLFL